MQRPQGARDFKPEEGDTITKFPVMVLPKADGVRGMLDHDLGSIWAKPRQSKPLVKHQPHIQKFAHCAIHPDDDIPFDLDGELYIPGRPINEINSAVKGKDSPWVPELEWHLFDIMVPDLSFRDRRLQLQMWYDKLEAHTRNKVKLLPCHTCHDFEEVTAWYEAFLAAGWEGAIIRDPDATYHYGSKTHKSCLRWKRWFDEEYVCVDIVDGIGKNVGIAKFMCECHRTGIIFPADPLGKNELRRWYYEHRAELIGKRVTIKYQNLTQKGIPRFAKMKCIRDMEVLG